MKQIRYYLEIVDINTKEIVYENGFWTIEGVIEEQEDWNCNQYEFNVEALEAEAV
jgi:hypothetical protein